MKTTRLLLATLLVAIAMTSCKSCKEQPRILKNGAMLYINVNNQNTMKVAENTTTEKQEGWQKLYTPKEVVEHATGFLFTRIDGMQNAPLGIAPEQLDVENARIKMWGEQIIDEHGNLVDYFIGARDMRITQGRLPEEGGDFTIAYIPNAKMIEAEKKIKEEYKKGNYDEVYRLFHEVYTAIPITQAEWDKLKAEGKQ